MAWLPDDRFGDAELRMEKLRAPACDTDEEAPHFCRAPKRMKLPMRFYRK